MVDLKLCFTLLFSLCRSGNSNFSSKNGDLTGNLNLELPLLRSFLGGYFGVDPLVERSCIWQGEVWKHHSNPSNISESPTSKRHVGQVTPLRDEVTILDIRVLLVPGEPISNHSKKKRRIWKTLKNYITPGAKKKSSQETKSRGRRSGGSLFHHQTHPLVESGTVGLLMIMQAIFLIPWKADVVNPWLFPIHPRLVGVDGVIIPWCPWRHGDDGELPRQ